MGMKQGQRPSQSFTTITLILTCTVAVARNLTDRLSVELVLQKFD